MCTQFRSTKTLSISLAQGQSPMEETCSTKRQVTFTSPHGSQDLYIARAQGEFLLEEELYKVLISIYRSPSVLFELTRRKIKQL